MIDEKSGDKESGIESVVADLISFVFVIAWIAGVVVAKAGWYKVLAIIFPPYALYKFVESIMMYIGLI